MSADGATLAVRAPWEDSATSGINSAPNDLATQAGGAYIFRRSGGAWYQDAYAKASNTGAGDNFGSAVALSADGSTLAIGASSEDSSSRGVNSTPNEAASDSGSVYLFRHGAVAWLQTAYVKPSNPGADDYFGGAASLSGDGAILAAGAAWEDSSTTGLNSTPNEAASSAGALYIYE